MNMLSSINELLTHLKEVELDTIKMSQDSMMMLGDFIEKNSIELDENAAKSLQYQDIISQQLTASIEAIENVQKSIENFENTDISDEKLDAELKNILEIAKDKREAFSGKLGSQTQDEIEFF